MGSTLKQVVGGFLIILGIASYAIQGQLISLIIFGGGGVVFTIAGWIEERNVCPRCGGELPLSSLGAEICMHCGSEL